MKPIFNWDGGKRQLSYLILALSPKIKKPRRTFLWWLDFLELSPKKVITNHD